MTHLKVTLLTSLTAILSIISSSAFAHTSVMDSSIFSGFLHPFSGLDHLLAMFAVGIWAAQQQNKTNLMIPVGFLAFLLIGFGIGISAITLPVIGQSSIEVGIALSVLILGLLIVNAVRLPTPWAVSLVGLFALYYGIAHGTEATGTSTAIFAIGFMLSSALLHCAGVQTTSFFKNTSLFKSYAQKLSQVTGIFIALFGASFLLY